MKADEKGFTLVEVLVAIAVLTIGILAMQMMQGQSIDSNSTSGNISEKSMLAAAQIEQILNLPYNDPLLADTDGDGTDQDKNGDGIDDDDDTNLSVTSYDITLQIGEGFGLRDSQCCPGGVTPRGLAVPGCVMVADHCPTLNPGDEHEIYWNVAVDHPLTNTKTINIIVIESADRRNAGPNQANRSPSRAEYTYIKADII